jgi:hypothetical protein
MNLTLLTYYFMNKIELLEPFLFDIISLLK